MCVCQQGHTKGIRPHWLTMAIGMRGRTSDVRQRECGGAKGHGEVLQLLVGRCVHRSTLGDDKPLDSGPLPRRVRIRAMDANCI